MANIPAKKKLIKELTDELNEEIAEEQDPQDELLVDVINISDKYIHIKSGLVNPGERGIATKAEFSCLADKYLERIV